LNPSLLICPKTNGFYYTVGNLKNAENLLPFSSGKEYTYSEEYIYDSVYRLVNFKIGDLIFGEILYPIKTRSWTLDPVGNWDQFMVNDESYQNTPNQMNEYDDPSTNGPSSVPDDDGIPDDFKDPIDTPGADGFNFAHDKNGNLVDDGVNTYVYDYENRLIHTIRKSDGSILGEYRYDALGRRIKKIASGLTTEFLYDGWRVIGDGVDKKIVAEYVYGDWIDEVLCMQREDQTYYYHTNKLGSIVALTDASGDVVERYAYDAYGSTSIMDETGIPLSDSAVDNPYMFTGRSLDPETGLYYYRARMYNPETGRFMSKDPLGMVNGPNMYTYVNNNPLNFIDPEGKIWPLIAAAFGLVVFIRQAATCEKTTPGACRDTFDNAMACADCMLGGICYLPREIKIANIFWDCAVTGIEIGEFGFLPRNQQPGPNDLNVKGISWSPNEIRCKYLEWYSAIIKAGQGKYGVYGPYSRFKPPHYEIPGATYISMLHHCGIDPIIDYQIKDNLTSRTQMD